MFSTGAVERRYIEVGNDAAHCACHCKVNSPGSLLVSEACYMFCWEPGGASATRVRLFACQVARGES